MLQATDLRNNICFLYKGEPYKVLKYKHTHLSRRGADIKVKAENLLTGAVLNFNFGSNDKFSNVNLNKKKMQFLYKEGDKFIFMDPKSFEQIEVAEKVVGSQGKFLKEGEVFDVLFWEDKILGLDMPASMVFTVSNCDPGVKGNSATNIYKNAQLSCGANLKVPLFVKIGDKIKVDTRSGEYIKKCA